MIVLGIAPGIASLAYSVVAYEDDSRVGDSLDADVLKAGRSISVASALEAAKRCRAHHLILDVVCDRYVPAMVAIGPPADPGEHGDSIAAVRLLLIALAAALRVPLVQAGDRERLLRDLGAEPRTLVRTVRACVPNLSGYRDKRIVLATAAAVVAAQAQENAATSAL